MNDIYDERYIWLTAYMAGIQAGGDSSMRLCGIADNAVRDYNIRYNKERRRDQKNRNSR